MVQCPFARLASAVTKQGCKVDCLGAPCCPTKGRELNLHKRTRTRYLSSDLQHFADADVCAGSTAALEGQQPWSCLQLCAGLLDRKSLPSGFSKHLQTLDDKQQHGIRCVKLRHRTESGGVGAQTGIVDVSVRQHNFTSAHNMSTCNQAATIKAADQRSERFERGRAAVSRTRTRQVILHSATDAAVALGAATMRPCCAVQLVRASRNARKEPHHCKHC